MTLSSEPSFPYPDPGEVIDGKYRSERLIGVGGMGAVIQATHLLRKAPVALKFMNPDVARYENHVERFINEAVAASRIDSEYVVKIFDVGQQSDGTPYLVMEYLEGRDLSDLLTNEGQPGIGSIPRCMHFIVQILRGLQHAHDSGIIHRDMKPSNCFVIEKDGDPDFVKLLDFGISKMHQPGDIKLTQTNSMLGTPLYMSPEQARSAKLVDLRSDLYSVGVILYELLAGKPPFDSDSSFTDLMIKIATAEPEPLGDLRPDIPPQLATIIRKSFARSPEQRFSSAFEMSEALAPWCDERSLGVIDASRRRAGRVTGLPSPSSPLSHEHAAAASVIESKMVVDVAMRTSDGGLASTSADPGSETKAASRNLGTLMVLGLLIAAVAVVGFVVFWQRDTNSSNPVSVEERAPATPIQLPASTSLSLTSATASSTTPSTASSTASSTVEPVVPPILVVEESESRTQVQAGASVSPSSGPKKTHAPSSKTDSSTSAKGSPRLNEITIQQ